MKTERKNEGFVLTGVLMLLLIATLVGGAFLFSARSSFATVKQWQNRDDCLLGLQSGLERRKYAVDQAFRLVYNASNSWNSLDVLGSLNTTSVERWTNDYSMLPHVVTTTVVTTSGAVTKNSSDYTAMVTVTNVAIATHRGITRKVREVIEYRYASAPAVGGTDGSVFNNVYFTDDTGFFNGVNADFNGDVYANKDLDLQYSSIRINGDRYAGNDIISHNTYRSDNWNNYGNSRARPAEYTDYNHHNDNTYWPQGYDQVVTSYEEAPVKEMPFVGSLSEYQDYAVATRGTVSDSNKTVAAVWGDNAGENAGIGTNDTGCLILIGTSANPIVISNIVVATGDIYIKGYYTGQGTLYAGRNVYVIGNLTAKNPPAWPHPDSNPRATATANKTKDFLGLCAKGSMVFGNPSSSALPVGYLDDMGTHTTDASDASLGYVSGTHDGVSYFNGDYTVRDANGTGTRSDETQRLFYNPMISDAALTALGVSSSIGWVDAVLYANHLIAGTFNNASLNGGLVCRDEAIIRNGNLTFNWDIRIGSHSYDGIGGATGLPGMLPRQSNVYRTIKWTELIP
ncbi:MAG: hypothetical protein WCG03_03215 [Kiritimatiellales bacterium]